MIGDRYNSIDRYIKKPRPQVFRTANAPIELIGRISSAGGRITSVLLTSVLYMSEYVVKLRGTVGEAGLLNELFASRLASYFGLFGVGAFVLGPILQV